MSNRRNLRVAIVGGSIAGLGCAAAIARAGVEVEVFERAPMRDRSLGAGMRVDLGLLAAVTRAAGRSPPHLVLRARRLARAGRVSDVPFSLTVSAYHLVREHLRAAVPDACCRFGHEVVGADASDPTAVRLRFADGAVRSFDAAVCADGRRSVLRSLVSRARGGAPTYAGYVLWRGFVEERHLPQPARARFFDVPSEHVLVHGRQQFVAYPVPGEHGEDTVGRRRLNWGWYHGVAEEQLRRDFAERRVGAPPQGFPAHTPGPEAVTALLRDAEQIWPSEPVEVVRASADARALSLHVVYEHVPDRLAVGRIALAGDSGHLASPITAAGGQMALLDAIALEEAFTRHGADVAAALRQYEAARLAAAISVVSNGWSAGALLR
jgi:2-polyprenyl-6-methoxyphenol hydroxylase-like FAD-dependent oxidoreductase